MQLICSVGFGELDQYLVPKGASVAVLLCLRKFFDKMEIVEFGFKLTLGFGFKFFVEFGFKLLVVFEFKSCPIYTTPIVVYSVWEKSEKFRVNEVQYVL